MGKVHEPCRHCGISIYDHDFETLAKDCYPKRIEKLEATIKRVREYAQDQELMGLALIVQESTP